MQKFTKGSSYLYTLPDSEGGREVLYDRLASNALEEKSCHTIDDFHVPFDYQDNRWQHYRTFHQQFWRCKYSIND